MDMMGDWVGRSEGGEGLKGIKWVQVKRVKQGIMALWSHDES